MCVLSLAQVGFLLRWISTLGVAAVLTAIRLQYIVRLRLNEFSKFFLCDSVFFSFITEDD